MNILSLFMENFRESVTLNSLYSNIDLVLNRSMKYHLPWLQQARVGAFYNYVYFIYMV